MQFCDFLNLWRKIYTIFEFCWPSKINYASSATILTLILPMTCYVLSLSDVADVLGNTVQIWTWDADHIFALYIYIKIFWVSRLFFWLPGRKSFQEKVLWGTYMLIWWPLKLHIQVDIQLNIKFQIQLYIQFQIQL